MSIPNLFISSSASKRCGVCRTVLKQQNESKWGKGREAGCTSGSGSMLYCVLMSEMDEHRSRDDRQVCSKLANTFCALTCPWFLFWSCCAQVVKNAVYLVLWVVLCDVMIYIYILVLVYSSAGTLLGQYKDALCMIYNPQSVWLFIFLIPRCMNSKWLLSISMPLQRLVYGSARGHRCKQPWKQPKEKLEETRNCHSFHIFSFKETFFIEI